LYEKDRDSFAGRRGPVQERVRGLISIPQKNAEWMGRLAVHKVTNSWCVSAIYLKGAGSGSSFGRVFGLGGGHDCDGVRSTRYPVMTTLKDMKVGV
jgi:hypothetical protein